MSKNGMRPVQPGEVLREDYLKPSSMSANAALAKALSVPAPRINDVVSGAASRLIRPCGSRDISVAMRVRG
jgi:plasmid maintenance system antidote protein VapI